jgi:hypothetical protein
MAAAEEQARQNNFCVVIAIVGVWGDDLAGAAAGSAVTDRA